MVVLDIKGVKQRINKKGEQTYRYKISLTKENLKELNIKTNQITNEQFKPVKVLNIKEYENLQKKESDEKQRTVAILNKIIEDQKIKTNESDSIIEEKNKIISGYKEKNKELDLKINDLKKDTIDFNQTIEKKNKIASDLTTQLQDKDNKIVKLDEVVKTLEKSLQDNTTDKNEISRLTTENTDLLSVKRRLKNKNDKVAKRIQEQDDEIKKLSLKLGSIKENYENILQNTKNQYQEVYNQLKKEKDQLNKDKEKCISLNSSLITDLKHVLTFGFFDLLRKKHKTTIEAAIKKEILGKNKKFKAVLVKDKH
jgi:DNA repair exonuclease SbcCD ATPase subunit